MKTEDFFQLKEAVRIRRGARSPETDDPHVQMEKIILFVNSEEEPNLAKKSPFPATNSLFPASQNR